MAAICSYLFLLQLLRLLFPFVCQEACSFLAENIFCASSKKKVANFFMLTIWFENHELTYERPQSLDLHMCEKILQEL